MTSNDEDQIESDDDRDTYQGYTSMPYGLQLSQEYISPSKHCDFQHVIHNNKTNDYIILDSRGISSWRAHSINRNVKRILDFEAYKFNTLRSLLYSRFYNVYFALTKEYGIKVYNLNFHEICYTESDDGSSVSRLLYNFKLNELITVCRSKLKFWKYSIRERNSSFHGIKLLREFQVAESLMLSNAEYDDELQRIYLLSDSNIYCYSNDGRCLFHLKGNTSGYFCVCAFSIEAQLLVAGSINGHLHIYSPTGGLVTTLMSHSRIVTAVVIHPSDGNMFFSASMDGTIKLFSFQMLGEIFSISAFSEGVLFMNVPSKNVMYAASRKGLQLYDVNYSFKYWSTTRCPVRRMSITPQFVDARHYVMVFATDYSIRLYSQMTGQRRSTVLPPPEIAIGRDVLSIAFDRLGRVMYILFNPLKLWIYSTRTDPATRVAIWDLDVAIRQSNVYQQQHDIENQEEKPFGASSFSQKQAEGSISCHSLLTVKRDIYETKEILASDFLNFGYLFCGLSNGSVCILDPCKAGSLIKSFKAHSTSPVTEMCIDYKEEIHLLTLIHTIHGWLVRIWDAVSLVCFHEIRLQDGFTQFVFKSLQFVIGYSSGHIYNKIISSLESEECEIPTVGSSVMKDHDGAILSVDIFPKRKMVCSCGADKYVRIWDQNKILLSEIKFDETLKYAVFLNKRATILISFKSQLFIIPHYVVFHGHNKHLMIKDVLSSGDESFIFEDPLVRSEGQSLKGRAQVLTTLANYLVPYPNLGLDSLWMLQSSIVDGLSDEKETDEEGSVDSNKSRDSICSFASTAIYQDSLDSSAEEKELVFPKCDDSPEPSFSAIYYQKEERNVGEEKDLIEKDLEARQDDASCKDGLLITDESWYMKLRNKTTAVSSSTTSVVSRPSKKSSKKLVAASSKEESTTRLKKRRTARTKKTKDRSLHYSLSKRSVTAESSVISLENENEFKADGNKEDKASDKESRDEKTKDSNVDLTNSAINSSNITGDQANEDQQQRQVSPVIVVRRGSESVQNVKMQNQQTLLKSITLPNHSLRAMATGKTRRSISHSYQQVMTSLMNNAAPAQSFSRSASMVDDDFDDDENILQLSQLIAGYEADTEGGSTLDVRGSQLHSRNSSRNSSRCSTPNNKTRKLRKQKIKSDNSNTSSVKQETRRPESSTIEEIDLPHQTKSNSVIRMSSTKVKNTPLQLNTQNDVKVEDSHSADKLISAPNTDRTINELTDSLSNINTESNDLSISRPPEVSLSISRKPNSVVSAENIEAVSSQNQASTENKDDNLSEAVKYAAVDPSPPTKVEEKEIDYVTINQNDVKVQSKVSSASSSRGSGADRFRRLAATQRYDSTDQQDVANLILRLSAKMKSKSQNNDSSVRTEKPPMKLIVQKRKIDSELYDANDNIISETAEQNTPSNSPTEDFDKNTVIDSKEYSSVTKFMSLSNRSFSTSFDEGKDLLVTASPVKQIVTERKKTNDGINDNDSETHCVVKFILSSFKKPKSPVKKERVQFKLSKEASIELKDVEEEGSSLKVTQSSQYLNTHSSTTEFSNDDADAIFITPQTSKVSFKEYSPVSSVVVRRRISDLTSEESLVNRSGSSLYDKLQKHRARKQKQKTHRESIQAKRSFSSGYGTTSRDQLLDSEFSMSRPCSSQVRRRLSIKRSPLLVGEKKRFTPDISKTSQRTSEKVYFEDFLPVSRPMSKHSEILEDGFTINIKQEKIRNLEHKLSGQNHRYHIQKTTQEIEADRLSLLMLKKRKGIRLPVEKTSASIPGRFPHEIIRKFLSSNPNAALSSVKTQ